ncbi:homocysteine-responsive endoplasmic reticulum-resident ubiquitin-like domain member 1 protein isoform X1 [Ciona intestinalis]
MSGTKIRISIRAANQHQADQDFDCEKQWQVKKLKELIKESYAGKPKPEEQRLIYGGKYLLDHEVLGSVLKVSNLPNIVHLVTSISLNQDSLKPTQTSTNDTSTLPTELRQRHTASNSQPNPLTQQYNSWQQMYSQPYTQQFTSTQMTPEQYTQAWQQYQQQMAEYMQYYGMQAPGMHMPFTASVTQTTTPAAAVAHPEPNIAPNAPEPVRPARDNNPPMNAQGGFAAADDDDPMRRDWLDVFFTLLRGGFFLSIVYFYSSFWRFIFILSLFVIIYIYQSGFFQVQRRHPVPQQPDNNNNGEMSTDDNDELPSEPDVPPPPSLTATAWCFVSTFFTSLIPQGPPVGAN